MANNNQKTVGWLEIGTAMAFALGTLTVLWIVMRAPVGFLYHNMRTFETGGLWKWSNWGRYFENTKPAGYAVDSIFLSSIPFGVTSAAFILLIGLFMRYRVEKKHIITHMRPNPDAEDAMSWRELMRRFGPLYPHNEFFLNFPMYRYSSSRGPASQPMSALELLVEAGAISFGENTSDRAGATAVGDLHPKPPGAKPPRQSIRDADKRKDLRIDPTRVRDYLVRPFGPVNPFFGINPRNRAAVETAVDNLPWYCATILYAALSRVNALHDTGVGLKEKVDESEEYLRNVWRAINSEKRKLGDKLVIGPYDYADPTKPQNKKQKKAKGTAVSQPASAVILKDHLAKIAGTFSTTKTARSGLIDILTKPAPGLDPAKPVEIVDQICLRHGFLFGVLASSMTDGKHGTLEAARATGVFAPNTFLWLRFVDRDLWRFLNYVGMQTPCPEAAGMFDHWQMELVLKAARSEPEVADTTVNAVIQEALKQSREAMTASDLETLQENIRNLSTRASTLVAQASDQWNDDQRAAPSVTPGSS